MVGFFHVSSSFKAVISLHLYPFNLISKYGLGYKTHIVFIAILIQDIVNDMCRFLVFAILVSSNKI